MAFFIIEGVSMKSYKEFSSIQLCVNPIDFRKGMYSLACAVQSQFDEPPFSGSLFLFVNKNRKNIRALYWDKTGFAMWCKALEKNCFPWPKKSDNKKFSLSQEQFNWLLSGIDPWKIKPHEELHYTII